MPPESRRPASLASNPAAAPEAQGPSGPDLGLEWEIFWTTHWKKAVLAIVFALVGVIGFSAWQFMGYSAMRAANAQLSAAKTIDDLKKVMADHPNADAAADAGLLLAQKQADAKDFEGAAKSAQAVADRFPKHPMFGAALLAVAANLEAAGKSDQADAAYQAVVEKAPNDFAAPIAMLGRANLAKVRQKPEEARKIYDELIAKFPKSISAIQAGADKRFVRGGDSTADVFKMPAPTPEPSPAPTAAPAATGGEVTAPPFQLAPPTPSGTPEPFAAPATPEVPATPAASPAAAATPAPAPAPTAAPAAPAASPAAKATPKPKK